MAPVHVAVGVVLDESGNILIARRAIDSHQGGLWEFPGGKVEPGESLPAALARELEPHELQAVLDYSARLKPPEELRAPPDWKNPDFIQAE